MVRHGQSLLGTSLSHLVKRNTALLRLSSRLLPHRWEKPDRAGWDREYAEGHWDRFEAPRESARYRVIAGFSAHLHPRRVLEVGCGSGTLLRLLKAEGYETYVGLDLSEVAIARARPLADDRTHLIACDADAFESDDRFDLVIFNEVLYYFDDVARTLDKYLGLLDEGGHLIVSLYYEHVRDEIDRRRALAQIGTRCRVVEEVEVRFRHYGTSIIQLLSERGPPRDGA